MELLHLRENAWKMPQNIMDHKRKCSFTLLGEIKFINKNIYMGTSAD